MYYKTFEPSGPLKSFVKCFWILENSDINPNASQERVLPDGCMELIFNYEDRFERIYRNGGHEIYPQSFLHGQIENYIDIAPTGRIGIVAVRFYPAGASAFIKVPFDELSDKAIDATLLFGKDIKNMTEYLYAANVPEDKIVIVENFLLRQLVKQEFKEPWIQGCVNLILHSQGDLNMKALRSYAQISERHLERKFSSAVGLTPKILQRIIRFQNILKLIRRNQFNSLGSLSCESGYYDQAHFIRDFKEFTGLNPRAYFAHNHRLSDYFTSEL